MEASENADPASKLFAGLDECYRFPALDARGTGGGIILMSEHINTLSVAAAKLFPTLKPAICEGTVRSYLAPYVIPWRILYDCQRQPMLEALSGGARPVESTVLTGKPKKSKKSQRAA